MHKDLNEVELLAPARDFEAACAAVLCGADAVYIGAPQFGAREAAGNSLETIRQVVELAHPYYVRVYAAVNTILKDSELEAARELIGRLYEIGVDGVIIQDTGLLEMDLPPIAIIASTQMNNASAEQVRFLEAVGFSRVILARELTLEQIRRIRAKTTVPLECFVHGALCVGASGQCYMSYALGGRSGNRGQCAQPCRRRYIVLDMTGQELAKDRYLLSLKDLSLADHLESLIDAGVSSFKIEGRLKEAPYVANVTGFYRQKLDTLLKRKGLRKSSSGRVTLGFEPNPTKTFNRGFTDYGIGGRAESAASINTPKSMGEYIGRVTRVYRDSFEIDTRAELHNADGICFFDEQMNLCGTVINKVQGPRVWPQKMEVICEDLEIYRNYDHEFMKQLQRPGERRIGLSMMLQDTDAGVVLIGRDEDGNEAVFEMAVSKEPAKKAEQARETIVTQLSKLGNTVFECDEVLIETAGIYFFPVSVLNGLKRGLAEAMLAEREKNRPKMAGTIQRNNVPYPHKQLNYLGNVLNEKAKAFYQRHGVETIEPAAESGIDMHGKRVMTTKYCLREELDLCPGQDEDQTAGPLLLEDEDGRLFRAEFRCGRCGMDLFWID